jgi:anaerobic selenocysteine-containing dehydrogenase
MTAGSTKIARTMCAMNCHPTFCGMLVEVDGGKLKSISGDKGNPDSQGFLCVRGRSTNEICGNPRRLLYPKIRDDRRTDAWRRVSWDEALDFRGLGGFGVGLTGALRVNTKEDMAENSRMIDLWGSNIASQPNTARHIISARRRGAKVITIDVRRTEATAQSDEVLLIRPGSDGALALAVMHVIVRRSHALRRSPLIGAKPAARIWQSTRSEEYGVCIQSLSASPCRIVKRMRAVGPEAVGLWAGHGGFTPGSAVTVQMMNRFSNSPGTRQ